MREWFASVPDFVITVAADYGTQTLLSDAKYPPFAGVRAWHWGNANVYVRAANSDGRIYRYSLGGSERTIDYDAAGNISVIVDPLDATLKQRSVYDDLDRVTDYFSDATKYDLAGNRTSTTISGETHPYTYIDGTNFVETAGHLNAQQRSLVEWDSIWFAKMRAGARLVEAHRHIVLSGEDFGEILSKIQTFEHGPVIFKIVSD